MVAKLETVVIELCKICQFLIILTTKDDGGMFSIEVGAISPIWSMLNNDILVVSNPPEETIQYTKLFTVEAALKVTSN